MTGHESNPRAMQADTYPSILPFGEALSRKVRVLQPYSRFLTCRVGKQEVDFEITDFLMRRFPFRTLTAWEERLCAGLVTQGGRTLKPGDRLLPEPPLKFSNPAQLEPSVPDETAILEKTGDFLLVYKPAPLPIHPGGRYNRNTLITILRERGLADTQPLLVLHRLDSVTSGLVLLGHNPAFSRTVQGVLARGEAEKTYLALVRGVPAEERMTVDRPIRRKHGYVFECHNSGKDSHTDLEVLRRFDGCALVRCRPRTGRTHQIRLHLREWGHPVIDDPVYGGMHGPPPRNAEAVVQNRAISLLHTRLTLAQEGLDFRLSDHIVEPAEPELMDSEPAETESKKPDSADPVSSEQKSIEQKTMEPKPIEPESVDQELKSRVPIPQAFTGADLHFLLD